MPKLNIISEKTNREWPADHPLRKVSVIIPDQHLNIAEFLVCTNAGEERLPPVPPDYDVFCMCCECGADLVCRHSAPKHPKPICFACWEKIK